MSVVKLEELDLAKIKFELNPYEGLQEMFYPEDWNPVKLSYITYDDSDLLLRLPPMKFSEPSQNRGLTYVQPISPEAILKLSQMFSLLYEQCEAGAEF